MTRWIRLVEIMTAGCRVWLTFVLVLSCLSVAALSAEDDDDLRLVDAVKRQQWSIVDRLLKSDEGPSPDRLDVNGSQADGATALHWAAHWNHVDATVALIEAGADVDARNDYGATALWVACASRNTDVIHHLLAADADPQQGLDSGETLLMRCARTGDPVAVRALVEHGADVSAAEPTQGQTALMWAAANRQAAAATVLIDAGADVEARTRVVRQLRGTGQRSTTSPEGATMFAAGGFTPLLFAARHGAIDVASILLEAAADLRTVAADGNTALVLSAMSGHGDMAKALLEWGADPNAAAAGYTALHAAVLQSDVELLSALLRHGADPSIPLTRGTPVPRWTYQLVLTLKEKGATPFALAAKYLEPEMMRLLIAAAANPHVPFADGTTPLMAAVGLGLSHAVTRRSQLVAPELVAVEWADGERVFETVSVIADVGGASAEAINQAGRRGNTALHAAASNGFEAVVDLLVGNGGSLDAENDAGDTPGEILASVRGQ